MKINSFKLEEYFAKWEFKARYVMCGSDPETISMKELVKNADTETQVLWDKLSLGYREVYGHPLLLQEIKTLYPMATKPLFCGTFAGGGEAIFCALAALLSSGDSVVVITPCYQSHVEVALSFSCHVE